MSVTLLFVSTTLCTIYMVSAGCKDIPESLSATYYMLGKRGWIFQTVMMLVGFLLMPAWIAIAKEQHIFLAFLSCASLMFVAAAPAFRLELEGKVHYASAAVCCTCAVLWQILEGMWDITVWFMLAAAVLSLADKDKWCWWLECAVISSLLTSLWLAV